MFHLFLFPRGNDCLKFLMIRNGTILGKEEGEMSPSHFICSVICSPFMIGAGRRIRGNNCLIPTSISTYILWQGHLFCLVRQFGKGQIKPQADLRTVDSSKKRMNEFVFVFAVKQKKKKWFIGFLGESMSCISAYVFI